MKRLKGISNTNTSSCVSLTELGKRYPLNGSLSDGVAVPSHFLRRAGRAYTTTCEPDHDRCGRFQPDTAAYRVRLGKLSLREALDSNQLQT